MLSPPVRINVCVPASLFFDITLQTVHPYTAAAITMAVGF
jgi:hypothetical protein